MCAPGHRSHAVASVWELNVPTAHAWQLALPGLAAYCPGRQGKQTAPVLLSDLVPAGQYAQRGAVQVVGSSVIRCRNEFHVVPGTAVHAWQSLTPRGRWASSPAAVQGTSQPSTVTVLPKPDRKSGRHSMHTPPWARMKGGHAKQPLALWS